MAKLIKIDDKTKQEMREEFDKALQDIKLSDGKFTFTKTIGKVDEKAQVYFTLEAWLKVKALVSKFDKEVAWHGIAKRAKHSEEEKNTYIISDILVYPQVVTGATVNTDQEKYQMWLMEQEDDVFNNIRFQGHSHVNMGVSPSSVDTAWYDEILAQLSDDMFYIFMIFNKKNEMWCKVYDMQSNICFEPSDVSVSVLDDGIGLDEFIDGAKKMVQDKVVVQSVSTTETSKKTSSIYDTHPKKKKGYYDFDDDDDDFYSRYYGYSGRYYR